MKGCEPVTQVLGGVRYFQSDAGRIPGRHVRYEDAFIECMNCRRQSARTQTP